MLPSQASLSTRLVAVPQKLPKNVALIASGKMSRGHGKMCVITGASVPGVDAPDTTIHKEGVMAEEAFEGNGRSLVEEKVEPVVHHPHHLAVRPGELVVVDTSTSIREEDEYEEPLDGSQSWRRDEKGYLLEILNAKVYDVAVKSPLEKAEKLSQTIGNSLFLKREDVQPVFSFKLRGAYNKMATLPQSELDKGVICSSAGNHAQGVALGAKKLGTRAIICMPVTTPSIKVEAVKRLGGVVELVGEGYQETQAYAIEKAASDGLTFIAPYDDPYTIAGQGTIGKEILEQISHKENLTTIFVAVGGGGLIAGISAYVKAVRPNIKVIGVEPSGANAMALSLSEGHRIQLSYVDAFADGVAVKQVGKETFRLCRELVDGMVLVDNSSISAAIKDVYNETRSILEPAGAVAVAGAKAYLEHNNIEGETVVAICSGANINFNSLRRVADLADVGANTEALLVTTIPEYPGAFQKFIEIAVGGTDIMITEFKYRYSAGKDANILWSAGISSVLELKELIDRLNKAGYPTMDISNVKEALDFIRGFVGGKARCYMGEVPHERVLKVTFPERVGALRTFLAEFSPRWNFTMFCYRSYGNRATSVLLGVQVPPSDMEEFDTLASEMKDFVFSPISEEATKVYKMFLE